MTLLAHGPYAPTVHTVSSSPAPSDFAYEADLGPAVSQWLRSRRRHHSIAEEVDSGVGIADLVLGTSRRARKNLRPPVTDAAQLRLLELTQKTATEDDLREWAPRGWSTMRRRTLDPLLDFGLLTTSTVAGTTTYRATITVSDPFDELTAVELKLRDWRRAIAQAGRYRLFAERAYVAMPDSRITHELVCEALRNNVGVIAVHPSDGAWEVTPSRSGAALQPLRRRMTSELVLAGASTPGPRRAGAPLL